MATTTQYYDLYKPEYSDDADIDDINDNMDTIDEVLHDLAEADDNLRELIGVIPEGSTVSGEINELDQAKANKENPVISGKVISGFYNVADTINGWPEYEVAKFYEIGDKVKRTTYTPNGQLVKGYLCKVAHKDYYDFDSSKWIDWSDYKNFAEIVGNGVDSSHRSNARALDWDGNEYLKGDLYVQCNANSKNGVKVVTAGEVATDAETAEMLEEVFGGGE